MDLKLEKSPLLQFESKGITNSKIYKPSNLYELSVPKTRPIDINGDIVIIETEVNICNNCGGWCRFLKDDGLCGRN